MTMTVKNFRSRTSFEDGWKWYLGTDITKARRLVPKAGTANGWSDLSQQEFAKCGASKTPIEKMNKAFQSIQLRPEDDETEWKQVSLPHDWRTQQKPDPKHHFPEDYAKAWHGWWPTGVAHYRKVFPWSKQDGQNVRIVFDGISGLSDVWMNGIWIGQSTSSYSPLSLDVTEVLRSDIPNVLLVRSDCTEAEGWWMEGSGVYRHVWLETYGDVHIAQHGIDVTTPSINADEALVVAEIEVCCKAAGSEKASVKVSILDTQGTICGHVQGDDAQIESCGRIRSRVQISVPNPSLWNLGKGSLYTLRAEVIHSSTSEVVDTLDQHFGIRDIQTDFDGVVVNGRKSKIYGVNIHQDFGFYGIALPDRIIEAKLDLLAEMGVNTVRSAHHQATPELVAHMDRRGMLLIAENKTMSTAPQALRQLRQHIRQFKSHPSIWMWSMENEELNLEGGEIGRSILQRLIRECKALDPTRPVTCGGVEKMKDRGYYGQLDIVGTHYPCFNGNLGEILSYNPGKPHILDEEGLYSSTRGFYHYDSAKACSGSFSKINEALFDGMSELLGDGAPMTDIGQMSPSIHDNMALCFTSNKLMGGCIWTGFDYHGEPIPQKWPAVIGALGQRDNVGIPKDYYWLIRSIFKSESLVHGFPHWTWPGKEKQRIPFAVYSNCDEVEIMVNEKVVTARLPVRNFRALVPDEGLVYEPGQVRVRGYRAGVAVAEHSQQTAGSATSVRLVADRTTLNSCGNDLAVVRVIVTDQEGNFVPDFEGAAQFSVSGAGFIGGSGNGNTVFVDDPRDKCQSVRVFMGQAVVFVHAKSEAGTIELKVTLDEVAESDTHISLQVSDSIDLHGPFNALDERQISAYGVYKTLN